MPYTQPGLHHVRKGDGRQELAVRLGAQADGLPAVDVESALADQPVVDDRVEEGVVVDVVDVPVDVVVMPAGRYLEQVRVITAHRARKTNGHRAATMARLPSNAVVAQRLPRVAQCRQHPEGDIRWQPEPSSGSTTTRASGSSRPMTRARTSSCITARSRAAASSRWPRARR